MTVIMIAKASGRSRRATRTATADAGAVNRPEPADPAGAEALFAGSPLGLAVYRRVQGLVDGLGPCHLRVARTQVGWARRRGFAYLWQPGRWLAHPSADVVFSVACTTRLDSPRWKEVVEVRPGLLMHHLEVVSVDDVDPEVADWLARAFADAG
jgi:hypothetical protein